MSKNQNIIQSYLIKEILNKKGLKGIIDAQLDEIIIVNSLPINELTTKKESSIKVISECIEAHGDVGYVLNSFFKEVWKVTKKGVCSHLDLLKEMGELENSLKYSDINGKIEIEEESQKKLSTLITRAINENDKLFLVPSGKKILGIKK